MNAQGKRIQFQRKDAKKFEQEERDRVSRFWFWVRSAILYELFKRGVPQRLFAEGKLQLVVLIGVGSNHSAKASFALATASFSVSPALAQPGSSGKTADQRLLAASN